MQVLTAEILSLYQKQGSDQASAAFVDLQKQATNTSRTFSNMTVSASTAYGQIERPLTRASLQAITREIAYTSGAFDNLGRGAGALVEGVGTVGAAFARLAGPLGLILTIGSLVALVFSRISDASKKAAENVRKQADSMAQLYADTEDAIEAGIKYGTLTTDQANRLRNENSERSKKLDRMKDERQRLAELIVERQRELEASRTTEDAARKEVARLEALGASEEKVGRAKAAVLFAAEREKSITEGLTNLRERQARVDKELLGLSEARAAVVERNNAGESLAAELARQQQLILLQRAADLMTLGTIEEAIGVKRGELVEAEQAYLDLSAGSDRQAVDAATARIEVVLQEIAILEKRGEAVKALSAKERAENTKRAAQFRQLSNVLAAGFENADKRIIFSWRSTMAATVEAAATAISSYLLMKAAENFKNPVVAAAYIAAAGVVQGLGSAAAGAIRAGGPGAGDTGGATGASEGSGAGSGAAVSEDRRQLTTINVNIQGDYVGEPAFIDRLALRLSERVTTGDVQLNASSAKYLAPAVGPA
jgi:hypothetical protein